VEHAEAGQRTAVNVPELEVAEIERGDVLCLPDTLRPSQSFEATVSLLADAPRPLGNRSRVRFHLGTSEILARVVLLDRDALSPGERTYAHVRLEKPSAALPGDRYVIRRYSPAVTIGGGTILDPNPPRGRRTRAKLIEHLQVLERGRPTERVERHLLASGFAPMTVEEVRARCDLDQAAVSDALRELIDSGRAVQVGPKEGAGVLHADRVDALQTDVLGRLADFHAKEPLKDGWPKRSCGANSPISCRPPRSSGCSGASPPRGRSPSSATRCGWQVSDRSCRRPRRS